jgi:pimeloyl-ACP methyl ester carboxylesterase
MMANAPITGAPNAPQVLSDDGLSLRAEFAGESRELAVIGDAPVTIHHPTNTSKGAVVLVPGWSGPRSGPADILAFLASRLAQAGYTAIRPDLPGRGDGPGSFLDCDLDKMIETVARAVAERGATRCTLVGMCSGGNVSLGVAALLKGKSDVGVVALSTLPFQPARTRSFENKRRWKNMKQYAAKALTPSNWVRLVRGDINLQRVKKNVTASEKPAAGERNLKDSARDIEKELQAWSQAGLFIYGGGDEEAPLACAHFQKLHESGMGAKSATAFHTIAGANHNFYGRAWREELVARIIEFLGARTSGPQGVA